MMLSSPLLECECLPLLLLLDSDLLSLSLARVSAGLEYIFPATERKVVKQLFISLERGQAKI